MTNTVARLLRTLLFAGLVLSSAACVTQSRYDEAIQELQYYQRSYHDLDSFAGSLQAQIAEMEAGMSTGGGAMPIDASLDEEVDARIERLRGIAERLGSRPGDVEILNVEGGYGLRIGDSILFDSGRSELRADGKALVLQLAEQIRSRPFRRVEVRGHTDSTRVVKPETLQRFPHGNIQLSTSRAIEVAAILMEGGSVEESKVVASGYGPNEPIAPNDTEAGRQRNRRVEIFILD